jgi:glycosyltransferase involved in cell wall biosynthesis
MRISFIGCSGVPNRYGGFEAFVEHCGPEIAAEVESVTVTCDARLYPDRTPQFNSMLRRFIPVRANGGMSVLHDALAFLTVWRSSTHIVVLGVSGGLWFPFFKLLCRMGGKRLAVNIDGVEWRRSKFGPIKRGLLRLFDHLAQRYADVIIYDNPALRPYVLDQALSRSVQIGYSGDHVLRLPGFPRQSGTALTVCRIEPENNLDVLIEGALRSQLQRYTIVGNWDHSTYGRALRERYMSESRLALLDPIYDPQRLAELRESCEVYLHGHSVGGTNPSLVEMLFYDCRLLCFDVPFNHETAGTIAEYFSSDQDLALLLAKKTHTVDRASKREAFSRRNIARRYLEALRT